MNVNESKLIKQLDLKLIWQRQLKAIGYLELKSIERRELNSNEMHELFGLHTSELYELHELHNEELSTVQPSELFALQAIQQKERVIEKVIVQIHERVIELCQEKANESNASVVFQFDRDAITRGLNAIANAYAHPVIAVSAVEEQATVLFEINDANANEHTDRNIELTAFEQMELNAMEQQDVIEQMELNALVQHEAIEQKELQLKSVRLELSKQVKMIAIRYDLIRQIESRAIAHSQSIDLIMMIRDKCVKMHDTALHADLIAEQTLESEATTQLELHGQLSYDNETNQLEDDVLHHINTTTEEIITEFERLHHRSESNIEHAHGQIHFGTFQCAVLQ